MKLKTAVAIFALALLVVLDCAGRAYADSQAGALGIIRCSGLEFERESTRKTVGTGAKIKVPVFLHLMDAKLDLEPDERRTGHQQARNLYVPAEETLVGGKKDLQHSVSNTWWNRDQKKPHDILTLASGIWNDHDIELVLVGAERCEYEPALLRLDGTYTEPCEKGRRACRDSIVFPDDPSSNAWSTLAFRSINKWFTDRYPKDYPKALHIVAWWWMGETAIFRRSPDGEGGELLTPAVDAAYARASGRGGPAVWISTYGCAYTDPSVARLPAPKPLEKCEAPSVSDLGINPHFKACARLLAHEIGHALRLHHVQRGDVADPTRNLMRRQPVCDGLTPEQKRAAADEAVRVFGTRGY